MNKALEESIPLEGTELTKWDDWDGTIVRVL